MVGQGWSAVVGVILVPVYVRWLGAEGYGLIGFFATLQASIQILDLGLSQTMSREMARYLEFRERAGEARDFVRTVEVGYWLVGLALGGATVLLAPLVASRWVHASALPTATVSRAIAVMGIVVALQWPLSLYEGGLIGLQRQVWLNAIKVTIVTCGGAGTVLVLWIVSPTITAYFEVQVVIAAANVASLAILTWRSLPGSARPAAFVPGIVTRNWRFAAGMGGIAVTGILLSQLDKLLVSKFLPLDTFGYYSLASIVSSVVPMLLAGPVFNAVFPQLTRLAAARDIPGTSLLYHRGTQLLATLVGAVAAVVALNSQTIVFAWTNDARAAEVAGPIASVLVLGMAVNALMAMPHGLQLAYGWTGLGLRINLALLAAVAPAIWFVTPRFGAIGAASVWLALNLVYLAVGIPLTHRRLLPGHGMSWVFRDVLPPATAAFVVAAGWRLAPLPVGGRIVTVAALAIEVATAIVAAGAFAPLVRAAAREWISRVAGMARG